MRKFLNNRMQMASVSSRSDCLDYHQNKWTGSIKYTKDKRMRHKPQIIKMRWLGVAVTLLVLYASSAWAFSINDVAKQAQLLASESYETPETNLPSIFRDMKYADYQQIQFNHDKAYWNNLKTPSSLSFTTRACISIHLSKSMKSLLHRYIKSNTPLIISILATSSMTKTQ